MNKKGIYVFINPDTQKPYSSETLRKWVIEYVSLAKIKKHITPHSLRRSYATNMYNNGVDIKTI